MVTVNKVRILRGVDDSQQRWQYKVVVRPRNDALYNCIKERETAERDTPLAVLTALPLHRIFKAQFHTIAVGVSVRGILKKKAIKHGGWGTRGGRRGGGGAARRKREEAHSTRERNCKVEAVSDRRREQRHNGSAVHPPWRATFHSAMLCARLLFIMQRLVSRACIVRARESVCTRASTR